MGNSQPITACQIPEAFNPLPIEMLVSVYKNNRRNKPDDCNINTVSAETLSKTDVKCVRNTPVVNNDSQEVDYIEKPLSSNNNTQVNKNKEKSIYYESRFFMVKDNHKVIRQSERKAGGEIVNNKIAGELPMLSDVKGWNENTPLDSKGNINMNNKSSHQIIRSIPLTIYHQNIRALSGKANELLGQLHLSFPQVLCLTEHHKNQLELQHTLLDSFKLTASYCRNSYVKGGACIFVQDGVRCTSIDLEKYCKDKDFEACACKVYLNTKRVCIIAIYRAPIW